MDIEWAFAGGELHILQARPITAYIPLAPELQTAPGEPRMFYIDRALTDGMTMSGPISPLTNDYIDRAVRLMLDYLLNIPDDADLIAGGFCLRGSRIYFNMSLYMHLMGDAGSTGAAAQPDEHAARGHARVGRHGPLSAGRTSGIPPLAEPAAASAQGPLAPAHGDRRGAEAPRPVPSLPARLRTSPDRVRPLARHAHRPRAAARPISCSTSFIQLGRVTLWSRRPRPSRSSTTAAPMW